MLSARDPDSVSTRSLLANALESVAQHEVELQQEAAKIRNAITIIDKQLFRLEATEPL